VALRLGSRKKREMQRCYSWGTAAEEIQWRCSRCNSRWKMQVALQVDKYQRRRCCGAAAGATAGGKCEWRCRWISSNEEDAVALQLGSSDRRGQWRCRWQQQRTQGDSSREVAVELKQQRLIQWRCSLGAAAGEDAAVLQLGSSSRD
jgi:hypothetical protein